MPDGKNTRAKEGKGRRVLCVVSLVSLFQHIGPTAVFFFYCIFVRRRPRKITTALWVCRSSLYWCVCLFCVISCLYESLSAAVAVYKKKRLHTLRIYRFCCCCCVVLSCCTIFPRIPLLLLLLLARCCVMLCRRLSKCLHTSVSYEYLPLLLLVVCCVVQEMIEEADRDQDGVVNADEFYRVMRKREDPLDDLDSDDEY